ncbi:MAG: hypothetical protein Q4G70_03195 [Pseudomonadota bacterium]|nr:hypothetical protein [Pseudomonadota bacterium]
MHISRSDFEKLVDWEPVDPSFEFGPHQCYQARVSPIFDSIEKLSGARLYVENDGGLSNYASAFVCQEKKEVGELTGIYVYLSLLMPLAAMGRGGACITENSWGYDSLEPSAVLQEKDCSSPLERLIAEIIVSNGYELLSPEQANEKLPEGIVPYEYCLNSPPWDRVFHVLFSDTD